MTTPHLPNLPEARREWSCVMLDKINTGACKRIVYWDHSEVISGDHGDPDSLVVPSQLHPQKRRRTGPAVIARETEGGDGGGGEEDGVGPSGVVSGDHRDPAPLGTTPTQMTENDKAHVNAPCDPNEQPSCKRQEMDGDVELELELELDQELETTPIEIGTVGTCAIGQGDGPRGVVSGDHRDPTPPGTPQVPITGNLSSVVVGVGIEAEGTEGTPNEKNNASKDGPEPGQGPGTAVVEGDGDGAALPAALATGVMPSIPQIRPGAAARAAPDPESNTNPGSNNSNNSNTATKPATKPKAKVRFGSTDV